MIYKVLADGVSIFDYDYPDMVLLDPDLETEVNTSGSLEFTMPPGHIFYNSIQMLVTDIEVYEGDTLVWFGRPIEIKTDYYKQKKVYCEGALAFFNDSVQELHEYTYISIHEFFRTVVTNHNKQVAKNRQFTVGKITIPDKKVYRKLHYEQTMDVLKRQCLNAEGGYFFVRRENGTNYIDWLSDMPYTCNQPIEFGLNLLSIGSTLGGSEIATCVLPLGDNDAETGEPITVASVNGGNKVIESEAAKTYGKITKAVTFSGVTTPARLYQDGVEYLNSLQFDHMSIECDASELHFINNNYEAFRVGQMIHCVSKPHLVERDLPLTKISLKMDTATKQITLGTPAQQTLTEIYAENTGGASEQDLSDLQDQVNDVNDKVDNLTDDDGNLDLSDNQDFSDLQDQVSGLDVKYDGLTDDSGNVSGDKVDLSSNDDFTALQDKVTELEKNGGTGGGGDGIKHEVVESLPSSPDANTIYFVTGNRSKTS